MSTLIRIFMQTSLDEIHLDKIVTGRSILILCKCHVLQSSSVQLIAGTDPRPLAVQSPSPTGGCKGPFPSQEQPGDSASPRTRWHRV